MSRIGLKPIDFAGGVKVSETKGLVSIEGPKGKMSHRLPRGITTEIAGSQILVRRRNDSKNQRSLHGLMRSLLANAVTGVSQGFSRKLEIHGVGYSADAKGTTVNFKLGFSHPIEFSVPEGIEVKVERNVLTVNGHDLQKVGQVAADIRALRPPDVYKLKGIRYAGESLRKKAGKTGAK